MIELLQHVWIGIREPLLRAAVTAAILILVFWAGVEVGKWREIYRSDIRAETRCSLEKRQIENEAISFCAALVGPLETRLHNATTSLNACNKVEDATYEVCRRVWGVTALAKGKKPKAAVGGGSP